MSRLNLYKFVNFYHNNNLKGWVNMQISERVKNVSPSLTLAITSRAKQMKKDGLDVVGFGAGEPDFDTPDYIKEAAKKAISDGFTKYTPVTGMIELKKAVCDKFKNENNLVYSTDEVAVSCGAKHSLFNYFQVALNPGDEVLVPVPYWVSYPQQVILAGGKPVFVETDKRNQFKVTAELLEKYVTPKTKAIILNSPSNPSGVMYTESELKELAEFFVKKNLPVVSDEIYEHITYEVFHKSIASFGDEIKKLTVVVNGVSKAFSMTGWRIGYLAADKEIIKGINKIQGHSTSNPSSISQIASISALEGGLSFVKKMVEEFKARRDYIVARLNSMDGISCPTPQGAFYVYPDISSFGIGSIAFCEKLLEQSHVAFVPGIAFGNDTNVRLSYAISKEAIEKGLDRFENHIKNL